MDYETFAKLLSYEQPNGVNSIGAALHKRIAQEGVAARQSMFAGEPTQTVVVTASRERFQLGPTSKKNLAGVKPELVDVVNLAIQLSKQDFTVYEGARTLARQRKLVAQGFSRTLNSKHLPQPDGYCHAVDLVPWINGHPVWDWDGCYKIAYAVDQASTELGFADNIRWGGAWDRVLADFGGDANQYKQEVELYKSRHDGKDFIDGPHFEWRD